MKQIFLALLIGAAALTGCGGKSLTIHGSVADSTLNGQMVYMTDLVADSIIDSCVVADAKFTFNRNVDSLYVLSLNIGRNGTTVLVEQGELNVELGNPSKKSGLPLNELLAEYSAMSDSLENDFSVRYQLLRGALAGFKGQDSINAAKSLDTTAEKMYTEYLANDKALTAKYLQGNEGNALGITLQMNMLMSNYDYELPQIDSALALYNPVVGKVARVVSMRDAAIARQNTSAGDMFVNFTGFDAQGKPVQLSDYVGKGNYVLLDFWASWCGPCRRAIPQIKALYEKYKGEGFVVVGANVWDDKEGFEKAMVEMSIPWAQICNFESRTPTDLYGVLGIPQIILFAPDGTIVERNLHGNEMAAAVAAVYKK